MAPPEQKKYMYTSVNSRRPTTQAPGRMSYEKQRTTKEGPENQNASVWCLHCHAHGERHSRAHKTPSLKQNFTTTNNHERTRILPHCQQSNTTPPPKKTSQGLVLCQHRHTRPTKNSLATEPPNKNVLIPSSSNTRPTTLELPEPLHSTTSDLHPQRQADHSRSA